MTQDNKYRSIRHYILPHKPMHTALLALHTAKAGQLHETLHVVNILQWKDATIHPGNDPLGLPRKASPENA